MVCTTFPVWQITRNVTEGRAGVDVRLMLPAALGCPHDYVLTPQDMHRLAGARVIVINGLGLDDFLGASAIRVHEAAIVDMSAGIDGVRWASAEVDESAHHAMEREASKGARSVANPHLFASPRRVAQLAVNVAAGLSRHDPDGAALYARNAEAYAARMNRLADELAQLGRSLANHRIVTQHDAFDYLACDMGLDVVAVVQAHPGQDPSASEMMDLIRRIQKERVGAIFTEPGDSSRIGKTIAREAGVPAVMLDPVASGPEEAPLDYYESVMRRNMEVLRDTLGAR